VPDPSTGISAGRLWNWLIGASSPGNFAPSIEARRSYMKISTLSRSASDSWVAASFCASSSALRSTASAIAMNSGEMLLVS
jgi:hypothetical protein